MKKILSSLVCVGVLSTFASANMVNVDLMYSTAKLPDSELKLDDDSVLKWNVKAQKYKNSNEDNPFVGAFRVGGRHGDSDILYSGIKVGKIEASLIDADLMGGYGFYIDEGNAKTKINLLAGFYRADLDYELVATNGYFYKAKVKTNALKVGISALSTFNNGLVASVDAYIKHYLDDKRKILLDEGEKLDSDTKFEIDGMLGYKFGKDDGFVLGLKGGYHNDLIGKGGHFGVSLGYIF